MTPTNRKLLEMIKENKSIEYICYALNISRKQLRQRIESIKKSGFRVERIYSPTNYDKLGIDYDSNSLTNKIINTCDIDNSIYIGLVADTHIGNELCDMDAIKYMYDFFASKGINFVFHLGDLVEGDLINKYEDVESQIISAISDYPKYDELRNFIVFGNHDMSFVEKTGIDLSETIEYYRDDFISLGFDSAILRLQDCDIKLMHKSSNDNQSSLIIGGHVHKYIFYGDAGTPRIICPTLSKINKYDDYPSALILKLVFNKNKICNFALFQYIVLDKKVVKASEFNYQYSKKKN